ncbi:hypothetical protein ACFE04_006418 [Oxalis oulophora]
MDDSCCCSMNHNNNSHRISFEMLLLVCADGSVDYHHADKVTNLPGQLMLEELERTRINTACFVEKLPVETMPEPAKAAYSSFQEQAVVIQETKMTTTTYEGCSSMDGPLKEDSALSKQPELSPSKPNSVRLISAKPNAFPKNIIGPACVGNAPLRKWAVYSTTQLENLSLSDEDRKTWEESKQALSSLNFSDEEKDKMLAKAFGHIHSPYWGEERKKEVPKFEVVNEILDYLKSLSLSDDDIYKVIKKFPEVLGLNLENELKKNVGILEKVWSIKGKTLRNLLLRNPKVLGYIVDCKGDCIAQCTRCWVRF